MTNIGYDQENHNMILDLLGYFDSQVLASYRNESQKYLVETHDFSGHLINTKEYFEVLEANGETDQMISIRFGYRTLHDDNVAIVAWLPDLHRSTFHRERWNAYQLRNPIWKPDDERFSSWVKRLGGDWEIEQPLSIKISDTVELINSLTCEVVGIPFFEHNLVIKLPAAENTHRYQDAHKDLYGYLIDGINKSCIKALVDHLLEENINIANDNTIKAIYRLFPELSSTNSKFKLAIDLVSKQRRSAAHGVRPVDTDFSASSQFLQDLSLCLDGLKELLSKLEDKLNINSKQAQQRHLLPQIGYAVESHYSINQATQMIGKTIERLELGFRKDCEDYKRIGSEVLIIYFTDGTIMGLEGGSNIEEDSDISSLDKFCIDFRITWLHSLTSED